MPGVPGVFHVGDTCNVWVIRSGGPGSTGVAIDFGSGQVLDQLAEMEVSRLTHVLVTHHHRDQVQGLAKAARAGVEIWVPPVEVELFTDADQLWQQRRVWNNYDLQSDRFSLLDPVPVAGTVAEYRTSDYGGVQVRTLPTPGHTPGSVSYLVDVGDTRLCFSGDLIYAPGKVWSLLATQWSYTGIEGPVMSSISALLLQQEEPDLLLPSHGRVMDAPGPALERLVTNLERYVRARHSGGPASVRDNLENPYRHLSDHLLVNTSSESRSYVLTSETGAALVIDFGYDMTSWLPLGGTRASQRPWLASLPALRRHFGVTDIEVALPTHYHDDHCAGMNLLRAVEGTEIWIPVNVAPVMAEPLRYDLPCQWFEPIPADKVLPLNEEFVWREYRITAHELPGHTPYAVAYEFEVDGIRVLATGDQDADGWPDDLPAGQAIVPNSQYRNNFDVDDYRRSASLYRAVSPDLMISGHWRPRWVDEELLAALERSGEEWSAIHRELLPLDEFDLPANSVLVRLSPYLQTVRPGATIRVRVELHNPITTPGRATLRPVLPAGWWTPTPVIEVDVSDRADVSVTFVAQVPKEAEAGLRSYRTAVSVDVTIGVLRLGQQAEALVEVDCSHVLVAVNLLDAAS